jgi:RHS repeat-associated protein
MSYFPYGEERTSTADGREKFGTYFRDPAANGGLDYADQRYYINASGRFLTPEPSRGTNAADPGSWSKYGYVGGDPVNLSDPTGLARCSAVGSFTTNSDPDNALNPVTTVEIQCTSFAGSVFADQFVTFPGGASPGDISNAESSLGTTVDQAERSNFMSVIEASRQRLLSSITDTCAKAIGAKNAARADKRLSRIKITLSDPGPIHVETDPSGHITGLDPNQYLAQYTSGFLRVGSIQFNSSVDWSYPANTFAIDQNGATVLYDATSGLAFQLGIGSMTANQFTDLILLHELAHSFGRNHPVDTQAYDQNIWSHCFQ